MSGRERQLFRATVIVVVLAGAYFLLVNPALTRWEALTEKEKKVRLKEREVVQMLRRGPQVREEIHDLEERITSSAPETVESDFHTHLKKIAEESKMTPSSVSLVKRQPLRDGFEEIVLSVNLECDMARLTDYLFRLEKRSDRLVKISRLDISRVAVKGRSAGDLGVNMILSTVVKAQASAAKPGGSNESQ